MNKQALLLEASQELLFLVSPRSLCIQAVNRPFCNMLGYRAEDLIERSIGDFECAITDLFFWDEMQDSPTEKTVESSLRHANGSTLKVIKTVRRVGQSADLPEGFFAVRAIPTDAQHQIENELASLGSRLRATLEATADGILLVNHEGRILNMNRRFATMWAIPQALLINREDALIFEHLSQQIDEADEIRSLEAHHECLEESFHVLRLTDGRIFERYASLAREDEEIIGRVFSYRDVTERYRTQQGLITANEEARRANQAKSEFLAMMSHEIRTPMNAIIGINHLMQDGTLDAVQRDYAKSIGTSAAALLEIINDILDFSKIEAGRLEVETIPFDLHHLLDDLVKLHALKAKEKKLRFSISLAHDVPACIISDPTRIRQILTNFLSNAFKFTAAGEVTLQVAVLKQLEGEQLQLSVKDTGIGISPAAQEKLFAPFTQADSSTTRRYGGTGLGLAITKQLVELLGGSIHMESIENQGTSFHVRLPLLHAAPLEVTPTEPAIPAQLPIETRQKAHILLVEDNLTNQTVALGLLRKLGYQHIHIANHGQEALDLIRAANPLVDVILMDCQMPVMDGYTATQTLRAQACRIPIIAMTANAMQSDREQCLAIGMDDFVSKPVSLPLLEAALNRCLATLQLNREAPASGAETEAAATTVPVSPPSKHPDIFDDIGALAHFDGDQELLKIVLESFFSDVPNTLAKLETALATEHAANARTFAHSIKGAAASVGAVALRSTAADMEKMAINHELNRAHHTLATLKQQFAEFHAVVHPPNNDVSTKD